MFWETHKPHGLARNPFKSCIVPRPIGWISSISNEGIVNLAPYSFFNGACSEPPMVMFGCNGRQPYGLKDTILNIENTGEFVCNLSTWETREAMNRSSASVGPEVDELKMSGLTPVPSKRVKPPRVKEAPVHLECKHLRSVDFPNWSNKDRYVVVFGEVIGVHIEDQYITPEGLIDVDGMKPIGRLGYDDYTIVGGDSIFTMTRPE